MLSLEVEKNWDSKMVIHDSGALYYLVKLLPIEFIQNCVINHALQVVIKDNYIKLYNGEYKNKPQILFRFYRTPKLKFKNDIVISFNGDGEIRLSGTEYGRNRGTTSIIADMNDEKSMERFYSQMNSFGVDILNNTIKE